MEWAILKGKDKGEVNKKSKIYAREKGSKIQEAK